VNCIASNGSSKSTAAPDKIKRSLLVFIKYDFD